MERMGYKREHSRSRKKPLRLRIHHWLARRFERYRLPYMNRSKRVRTWLTHVKEEMLYSQRMGK